MEALDSVIKDSWALFLRGLKVFCSFLKYYYISVNIIVIKRHNFISFPVRSEKSGFQTESIGRPFVMALSAYEFNFTLWVCFAGFFTVEH